MARLFYTSIHDGTKSGDGLMPVDKARLNAIDEEIYNLVLQKQQAAARGEDASDIEAQILELKKQRSAIAAGMGAAFAYSISKAIKK